MSRIGIAGAFCMSDEPQSNLIERRRPGVVTKSDLRELMTPLELRADGVDGTPGFSGYASTHWHVDSYGTAFAPGAWRRSIKDFGDQGVPVLWQHWPDEQIGNSLSLKDDRTGLAVTAGIDPEVQRGHEALSLARRGWLRGLSVGFKTLESRSATDDDPVLLDFAPEPLKAANARSQIEIIEKAQLWEFSVVTFPANQAAAITAMRAHTQRDALLMALDDLKANRLDEDRLQIAEQLALALRDRLERRATPTPPPPAAAPQAVVALLQAQIAYLQSA